MQALQLVAPRRFELKPMPDPPDPGPGEVAVRLRAVGICGSDMHYFLEGGCAGNAAPYPCVLGHEPAGDVVATGSGVENVAVGARVAVEPAIVCGHCEACRAGARNLCENCVFLGGVQAPGLLREYAVVPAGNVVGVPDTFDYTQASLVEPVAVLLHSIELVRLRLGEAVVVLGAGPIGLLAVAVARQAGAGAIVIADRVPHRLEAARKLGADLAVNLEGESVHDAVMDLTHGAGAHVGIDAAGKAESINNAIACLRFGGRLCIVGIASQAIVGVDLWTAGHHEISMYVQKRSNGNDHEAMDLLRRGFIDPALLVSHRFPLSRGQQAFDTVADYADGVVKAVIEL